MENNKNSRSPWPYIVTAVAIIIVVALVFALLIPNITSQQSYYTNYSVSEYDETETSLKSPASYDELYEKFKQYYDSLERSGYSFRSSGCSGVSPGSMNPFSNGGADVAVEGAAEGDVSGGTGSASKEDYSDTNIRTEGVLEADIVKTDGRYIYSIRQDNAEFSIVDSRDLSIIFKGNIFDDISYKCHEFYINDDKLYITGFSEEYADGSFRPQSFLLTYDISDKEKPVQTDKYVQDGSYCSARVVGDYFYLFTNYSTPVLSEKDYLPYFGNEKVACEDIYFGKYLSGVHYYCVGAVDLNDPSKCISSKAVLTGGSEFYVSDKTAYVLTNDWVTTKANAYSETNIVSLGYDNGNIEGKAIGSAEGYIKDSFCIDEYNGYLRMVTTTNSYTNSTTDNFFTDWFGTSTGRTHEPDANMLLILDDKLQLVSSIDGIQEHETIKSARFMGDALYFVTFRQTDPLFVADLSNPAEPKILDGLKVSGFSDYLHLYSDDLLLGIGYEADENTGITTGAKVSMFDISNPFDVKEIDRIVINDANSVSSVYSYKAVMVEPEKNLIGFSIEKPFNDYEKNIWGRIGEYHLLSYDKETGFEEVLTHELFNDYETDYFIYEEGPAFGDIIEDAEIKDDDSSILDLFDRAENDTEKDDIAKKLKDAVGNDAYNLLTIGTARGLYIGNQFYIVQPGVCITQYNLNNSNYVDNVLLFDEIIEPTEEKTVE